MGSSLTQLGKVLRKQRIDADERIADLAEALGVTSSFVSAIELGKRSPTEQFLSGVVKHYALSREDEVELRQAAVKSTGSVRIDLDNHNDLSRELAVAFARAFPTIDQAKANELLSTLRGVKAPKDEH
jgi:HTH-type transcriptional regulator, competence development regulator